LNEQADAELVGLIFSWSLQDVANQDLFRDKVIARPTLHTLDIFPSCIVQHAECLTQLNVHLFGR
jgi:hypothetical protein